MPVDSDSKSADKADEVVASAKEAAESAKAAAESAKEAAIYAKEAAEAAKEAVRTAQENAIAAGVEPSLARETDGKVEGVAGGEVVHSGIRPLAPFIFEDTDSTKVISGRDTDDVSDLLDISVVSTGKAGSVITDSEELKGVGKKSVVVKEADSVSEEVMSKYYEDEDEVSEKADKASKSEGKIVEEIREAKKTAVADETESDKSVVEESEKTVSDERKFEKIGKASTKDKRKASKADKSAKSDKSVKDEIVSDETVEAGAEEPEQVKIRPSIPYIFEDHDATVIIPGRDSDKSTDSDSIVAAAVVPSIIEDGTKSDLADNEEFEKAASKYTEAPASDKVEVKVVIEPTVDGVDAKVVETSGSDKIEVKVVIASDKLGADKAETVVIHADKANE